MSDGPKMWDSKTLAVSDEASQKIHIRRLVHSFTDVIKNACLPYKKETEDGEEEVYHYIPWTNELWSKFLHNNLEYLVDKRGIVKYKTENVEVINGCPSADIFIVPARTFDYIKIDVKVTKNVDLFS